ncbi:hypothetical protein [Coleofasciculus sp. FACHB-SPT9]|uniref:hypothetical protein n=1 Tax=Cyanophyceae TaxID=3028117 RepID=UPI001682573E|nr:hypothetical protein [Coleofasciculus sp. FACHB-SPT9]MBD1890507.1 hypothetical protein [Coleofasciculus sp. FACHB-SPT9]
MTSPRPLGQRELELIQLYANCQLGMSPRAFEAKWNVTRSHLIEPTTLYKDDFERFFELRMQALSARINRAMGKGLAGESLLENGNSNGFHPKRFIDYHAPR